MKPQVIFSYLIIALLSCHKNSANSNDNIIVGEWSNCQRISFQKDGKEIMTSYNVCPIIVFVKDHSGYIRRQRIHALPFTWSVNENKLIIKHSKIIGDDIIDDGSYQIRLENKKSSLEMSLLDTIENRKYILGR